MSVRMLYLWDSSQYGLPKTLAESRQIFTKLYEDDWQSPENLSLFETSSPTENKKYTPSHGLLAFAQRIQDIAHLDKTIEGACRKPYLHLAEKAIAHQQALFALELPDIPQSRFLPMLLRIIETARQFGLIVVDDDNLGMVFLPSGDILPPEKEDLWIGFLGYQEDKNTFKSLDEFQNFVEPLITKMMISHGLTLTNVFAYNELEDFEKRSAYYSKTTSILQQDIYVGYEETRRGYLLGSSLHIKSNIIDGIYNKFDFFKSELSTVRFNVGHFLIPTKEMHRIAYLVNTQQAKAFIALIEKLIFPLLDAAQDIVGLDNVLNGDFLDNAIYDQYARDSTCNNGLVTPISLIVARLANNPHFEELAVSLATPRMPMANRDLLETEWPKLVKYLREEVQPLV